MLPITKEKVLTLIALLVSIIVLASCRVPSTPPVEPVPPEEGPGVYTSAPGTVRPRLAPETSYASARDPFRMKDPWTTAPPALLAVPPAREWPRALPGGVETVPTGEHDRLLIERSELGGTK